MDGLLKATAMVVLVAPLALAIPTAPEAPAVSEGYEELSTYFEGDLAATNDSEAQDGANRVLTGFGYGFGDQYFGSYPGYPQGAGLSFNQWQYNDGYYDTGYQQKCSRYCPGSRPGSYICCVPSHPNEPRCPEVRPTCNDPYYYSGPPQRCESSHECMPSSLCCYDTCLKHKTCKPAQYG
ncbi:uncharacterized protein LOC119587161 isoform X2 [Penaeus monodon]|uniref:uncharacterized protein LOC119587161 isoform X2 n=1 Tax=Penaeus monodon TaxID=6687 RepID=UPI0018A7C662|nr:uncharacterized protein LOC119587161 isoform X2 [Penaeus monodon]